MKHVFSYVLPMINVSTHNELLDALGGNLIIANENGWKPSAVGAWRPRNRIPPDYWPEIIQMAASKNLEFVSADWLAKTWPQRVNKSQLKAA